MRISGEQLFDDEEEDEHADEDDEDARQEKAAAPAVSVSAMDQAVFQEDEQMRAVQDFAIDHGFAVRMQLFEEGLVPGACSALEAATNATDMH